MKLKSSILCKHRTLHTLTPRVPALRTALFAIPMLFAVAPVGAVQFSVTNLGTLGGTVSVVIGPIPQIAPKKHAVLPLWQSGMRCCGRPM